MNGIFEFLNSNLLNTEMKILTFINVLIQVLFLFWCSIYYLARPNDVSRLRFMSLIIAFLAYNIFGGLFPDPSISMNLLLQNILAYSSGIVLPVVYFHFITQELNIDLGYLFKPKILLSVLVLTFVLFYIIPYILYKDFNTSREVFIIIPVIVGLLFWYKTVKYFYNNISNKYNESYFRVLALSGYVGIGFIASLPIVTFFGDYQVVEVALVNMAFYFMGYAMIKRYIHISKYEIFLIESINDENGNSSNIENKPISLREVLTARQFELSELILKKELSYGQIAEITHIADSTVRKHASNIFDRLDVSGRDEFIDKYTHI